MFFELKRYRAILALAVIPIGIVRNALRILTIGLLCVHFGPDMIHSVIHRKGGPLYRRERKLRRS
jgi:exosortase/archaeosortase family protein